MAVVSSQIGRKVLQSLASEGSPLLRRPLLKPTWLKGVAARPFSGFHGPDPGPKPVFNLEKLPPRLPDAIFGANQAAQKMDAAVGDTHMVTNSTAGIFKNLIPGHDLKVGEIFITKPMKDAYNEAKTRAALGPYLPMSGDAGAAKATLDFMYDGKLSIEDVTSNQTTGNTHAITVLGKLNLAQGGHTAAVPSSTWPVHGQALEFSGNSVDRFDFLDEKGNPNSLEDMCAQLAESDATLVILQPSASNPSGRDLKVKEVVSFVEEATRMGKRVALDVAYMGVSTVLAEQSEDPQAYSRDKVVDRHIAQELLRLNIPHFLLVSGGKFGGTYKERCSLLIGVDPDASKEALSNTQAELNFAVRSSISNPSGFSGVLMQTVMERADQILPDIQRLGLEFLSSRQKAADQFRKIGQLVGLNEEEQGLFDAGRNSQGMFDFLVLPPHIDRPQFNADLQTLGLFGVPGQVVHSSGTVLSTMRTLVSDEVPSIHKSAAIAVALSTQSPEETPSASPFGQNPVESPDEFFAALYQVGQDIAENAESKQRFADFEAALRGR